MSDPTPETNPWTTLSSRETYSNPWIRVREDQVLNPNGGRGIYGVVEYQNRAVGVVVMEGASRWLDACAGSALSAVRAAAAASTLRRCRGGVWRQRVVVGCMR